MAATTGTSAEEVNAIFDQFLAIANDTTGWTDSSEKLGVKVTQKTIGDSGISVVKGEGEIKGSPDQVFEYVWSVEQRPKWDTFFESGRIVKDIEPKKLALLYYKTKSSMTVWPRDFSCVAASRKREDGSIVVVAKSVKTPEIPDVDGCVRGNILISGALLTPLEGGKTKISYIFQVDAAGWVPTSVVNLVNIYQPLGIIGIRKLVTGSPQP